MLKFKFFVHCTGWKNGGYENAHFAETEKQVHEIIDGWNKSYSDEGNGAYVELLSIEELTDEEFSEDYIGCF